MISIIVPVYNVERFLSKCLQSLIEQTYRDIEILCINDGSTDHSWDILTEYAKADSRISVVNNSTNCGLSESRNQGIEMAQGELIMFVDSDDWVEPTCCEKAIKAYGEDADLCFFSYILEYGQVSSARLVRGVSPETYSGEEMNRLYRELIGPVGKELSHPERIDSMTTAWGKLFSTKIIREHNIRFVSTLLVGSEDILFNVYYFSYVKKAQYIPDALYHYRKDNYASLTKTYKPDLPRRNYHLFSMIEQWLRSKKDKEMDKALMNRRALSLLGMGLNITSSGYPLLRQNRILKEVLAIDWYHKAVSQLPLSYFPFYWKAFYFLAKIKCSLGILFLLNAILWISKDGKKQ